LITKKSEKAIVERADTCVVFAASVIAENMCAIAITEAFLEKFGSDTLQEIKNNFNCYIKKLKKI
ncbi:MAG: chorismate synthase, partial [Candidatus Aenigmatarchaeota archaeon]